ncbi:MAG: hypothetical protein IIW75_06530 [Bacteroidaceae bacterium]|nr:hypothetical protein [Bacteroidaceae bacterium]
MKKFLMAAIAVFVMSGAAVAADNAVVEKGVITVAADENVADKLIALMKSYTTKANAATSMEALEKIYAEFETAMFDFAEKNSDDIAEFEANLTEEAKGKYEVLLQKAMEQLTKAFEKKAMHFMGE